MIFPARRMLCGALGTIAMFFFGQIHLIKALTFINWNIMGILIGMFFVADAFMLSNVPAYLAEWILYKLKKAVWGILAICFLTGFISAFVENVSTFLVVAPIALALSKRIKMNPTIFLIALAVSSNLQGAATLTGDPPSMLLASFMNLTFSDFFFYQGKVGIFFAVQIGACISLVVLYLFFRKEKQEVSLVRKEKVESLVPAIILMGVIIILAVTSFVRFNFEYLNGTICMAGGFLALFWLIKNKKKTLFVSLKELDWQTMFFLMTVFILVGVLIEAGWMSVFADKFSKLVGSNQGLAYIVLITFSVFMSAFIDNIPFLVAMLPVVQTITLRGGFSSPLFFFGLLIGASLGGNITPIGASANIVSVGLLKKNGHFISFWDFVKVGLPFTLAAVTSAALFNWWLWVD
ncbi:hypothetical protein KAI68_00470 [bacterium]|nr:hypothetical protein [bacterium]